MSTTNEKLFLIANCKNKYKDADFAGKLFCELCQIKWPNYRCALNTQQYIYFIMHATTKNDRSDDFYGTKEDASEMGT